MFVYLLCKGRRLSQDWKSVHAQCFGSTAKHIPSSIDELSPFLTKLPHIRHLISSDRLDDHSFERCGPFPWYERHCDIFTIESSSDELLYEPIKTEMTTLRQDCKRLLHGIISGQERPWKDIWTVILGTDANDTATETDQVPDTRTFVFIVYWSTPEAMARVKDPEQDIISKHVDKISSNWWDVEILGRLAKLRSLGASVERSTFHFRDLSFQANPPLVWPDAEILAARQASGECGGGKKPRTKRDCCKSCRLM